MCVCVARAFVGTIERTIKSGTTPGVLSRWKPYAVSHTLDENYKIL